MLESTLGELEEYFKEKKRIGKKYASMLELLAAEESSAIVLAVKNQEKNEASGSLPSVIIGIHQEYLMTKKLIMEQKIMEEDENVKKYTEMYKTVCS